MGNLISQRSAAAHPPHLLTMSPKAKNDGSKAVEPKPKAEDKDAVEKEEKAPEMPEFKVSAFIAPGALAFRES